MIRHEFENGVVTYQFELLVGLPVTAHVSTRLGGVSPVPWDSLNFSVARGDTPERVEENRRRFAEAVGVDARNVVRCHQVHGTGVAKVDWEAAGSWQDRVDALVTDAVRLPMARPARIVALWKSPSAPLLPSMPETIEPPMKTSPMPRSPSIKPE